MIDSGIYDEREMSFAMVKQLNFDLDNLVTCGLKTITQQIWGSLAQFWMW